MEALFSKIDLSRIVQGQLQAVKDELEGIDRDRFLNTAPDSLVGYLIEKYQIRPLVLHKDQWHAQEEEAKIDVRLDPGRAIRDPTRPVLVPGQRITVTIPFDGDPGLFRAQASSYSMSPPRGTVRGSELLMFIEFPADAPKDIRAEIERNVSNIESHLAWQAADIAVANKQLAEVASRGVHARRERLLKNAGRLQDLGIPVKPRPGSSETYAAPTRRIKATPALPAATGQAFQLEPAWAMEHYEHALKVMNNMAIMMERSPSTFAQVDEEGLRDHFLVQLNGHFEGASAGETFNHEGKTDILLREAGRNVFIAECKFWNGPKHYAETIDQLLNYTAWRDSKTVIMVFNRGGDTTSILKKVKDQTTAHPNFRKEVTYAHESGTRYVFHQKNDPNREFLLTVLVFDVPEVAK